MDKQYTVYLMTNRTDRVIYTGVTSNLAKRVYEHKNKLVPGFTSKYQIDKLVYYELFNDINEAIAREKQIKGGSRAKKLELIDGFNPGWQDLYDEVL